ncbi:hypothetical protein CEDELDFK_00170 [Klebsiella phage 066025]|uniref:Uncharacterized protein n=2 Tax=Przondovirus TaxID=1985720 RepID=A0A7S6U3E9_9CAUD|nr:hypothetical protein FMOBIAMD_00060 [Klebsiella phage 066022]QOV06712.1 hypothetical protein CEDELDFK_00170 [Klebsiella phage 066025]QOV06770.1 hypothetical protein CIPLJCMA_00205 [Klebsiella phage 066026]QOV06901.1 hypothetical protein NELCCKOC_00115 [Klebsiella phage 066031]QOV07010.1 hypothetical protein KDLGFLPC_00170 [Klebsiella phage 066036]QOV07109.1 hypothetical protein LJEJJENJ_00160 [Klebsiella phage 066038]QOV07330.1 hypothetical protein BPNOODDK_00110 [Klebsiella phage 066045]
MTPLEITPHLYSCVYIRNGRWLLWGMRLIRTHYRRHQMSINLILIIVFILAAIVWSMNDEPPKGA